jgi:hypothetical protein
MAPDHSPYKEHFFKIESQHIDSFIKHHFCKIADYILTYNPYSKHFHCLLLAI